MEETKSSVHYTSPGHSCSQGYREKMACSGGASPTQRTTAERDFESDTRNFKEARQELYPLHTMAALKGWKACMARVFPLIPVTLGWASPLVGPPSLEPSDTQVDLYLGPFHEAKVQPPWGASLPASSLGLPHCLSLKKAMLLCGPALLHLDLWQGCRFSLGSSSVSHTALMWGLNETKAGGALTTAFRKS